MPSTFSGCVCSLLHSYTHRVVHRVESAFSVPYAIADTNLLEIVRKVRYGRWKGWKRKKNGENKSKMGRWERMNEWEKENEKERVVLPLSMVLTGRQSHHDFSNPRKTPEMFLWDLSHYSDHIWAAVHSPVRAFYTCSWRSMPQCMQQCLLERSFWLRDDDGKKYSV